MMEEGSKAMRRKSKLTPTVTPQVLQARRSTENSFVVYDIYGKKLGETKYFDTAMIMHVQHLSKLKDKRPELLDLYAGVSENPESFGHPLFTLS